MTGSTCWPTPCASRSRPPHTHTLTHAYTLPLRHMHAHTLHLSLTSHVHVTCYYTWHTQTCVHSRTLAEEDRRSVTYCIRCCLSHFTLGHSCMSMRHRVPMSTWYDQLVGTVLNSSRGVPRRVLTDVFSNWIWSLTRVPRVTGCLCVQDCWTALISTAKEGHIEVVRELLENNANLEHRDMVRIRVVTEF